MKGLQIGLPPLAVLSRGPHRLEPDRHQRAERRIDRRLGCAILKNGYSPLRRLSSLLGWKTHHTLSFQLFQQDQTRLDLEKLEAQGVVSLPAKQARQTPQ